MAASVNFTYLGAILFPNETLDQTGAQFNNLSAAIDGGGSAGSDETGVIQTMSIFY